MRQRCRVKVCGVTSVSDAQIISAAGADAIGLMFYSKSSRHVTLEQAALIAKSLPPFVASVGLFLDAEADFVRSVLAQVPLNLLQFHGSETADFCEQFNKPYLKALGMLGRTDTDAVASYMAQYPQAQAFLVDSHAPGAAGGTGRTFDWQTLPKHTTRPLILAGGLKPENVQEAILTTGVYAVDVSTGVEASPGIKDPMKVQAFMQNVYKTL